MKPSRSTFITSMFVISLVMLFLGIFTSLALYSNLVLEQEQESFEMRVELPGLLTEEKRGKFETFLAGQAFVKELKFVSKTEAGNIFTAEYGDEWTSLLDGTNPFPPSYKVFLKASYIKQDSINKIQHILENQSILGVIKIDFPIDEINNLKSQIDYFIKVAIIIGIFVCLVAFFIVNSTIRLEVYSKRLMIRSMQLIGATGNFIRRPFLKLGIAQGLFGALLTNVLLTGVILGLDKLEVSGFEEVDDLLLRPEFMILLAGILIFGIVLGWVCSNWAVNRFLNKNLDELM